MQQILRRGLVFAGLLGGAGACSSDITTPSPASDAALTSPTDAVASLGTLRVRCERRSDRSKISVDGNNLSPRGGNFRGRVKASGGIVTSALKRAVGDEVEFDFDSNRNDIAAGATRIAANFIAARSGPDVIGEILNSAGVVVARQGVECSFR